MLSTGAAGVASERMNVSLYTLLQEYSTVERSEATGKRLSLGAGFKLRHDSQG